MADDTVNVYVDGTKHELELTLGELEELEDIFGSAVDEIDMFSVKAALYLAWFALRRQEPDRNSQELLMELRARPLSALNRPETKDEKGDDVPPPTESKSGRKKAA